MTVTSGDIDTYVPGRGTWNPDRIGWLNYVLKLLVADIAAVSGGGVADGDKGDITVSGASTVWTVDPNSITYAKMQDISATARLLGRITAGAGDTEELNGTQATTLLDTFTSALKGLAPASGGGTTNFLRADGSWAAPGGGGGGSLTLTAVEKDLGSIPAYAGTFQITGLSSLTVGKPVLVTQLNGPYTGKGTLADEAEMDRIECTGEVDSTTTIRVYWTATPGPVTGNFKFGYQVSA